MTVPEPTLKTAIVSANEDCCPPLLNKNKYIYIYIKIPQNQKSASKDHLIPTKHSTKKWQVVLSSTW